MLIKLLEQLPQDITRLAMAYTVAGPVEKLLLDVVLGSGSDEGGSGNFTSGKTNAEAVRNGAKEVEVKPGETITDAVERGDGVDSKADASD